MAYCPCCQHYIEPKTFHTQALVCPSCQQFIRFNKKEYNQVIRPGVFIVAVFILNAFVTQEFYQRLFINISLLLIWFAFYLRFRNYLKVARLEQDLPSHEIL